MNRLIKYLVPAVAILCLVSGLHGQEDGKGGLDIRIDQIISDQYPEIRAYAVIKDAKGNPVPGLSPSLFSFRIDSAEVKVRSEITPFSMADERTDYTIMVSNNGIMEGEPLDFQKNAILKFVELMGDDDTLSVYTIGEDAGVVCEDVGKKNFDSAVINGIEVSSSQPRLYDSVINLVRKVEQRRAERKVIIVMSDGRDQNSRFTKAQLTDALEAAGIPIYAVGMRILSNETLSLLDEIAQLTGGTYYYSSRIGDVPDKLRSIVESCTQSYIIDLKVRNLKADDLAHILEVRVDERDAQGRGLKTFVAVKLPFPKWLKITVLAVAVLLAVALVVFVILRKRHKRKAMGITRRRCRDCGNIMKDSWESCPFCRYMDGAKAGGKKKKDKKSGKKDV